MPKIKFSEFKKLHDLTPEKLSVKRGQFLLFEAVWLVFDNFFVYSEKLQQWVPTKEKVYIDDILILLSIPDIIGMQVASHIGDKGYKDKIDLLKGILYGNFSRKEKYKLLIEQICYNSFIDRLPYDIDADKEEIEKFNTEIWEMATDRSAPTDWKEIYTDPILVLYGTEIAEVRKHAFLICLGIILSRK